MAREGRQRCRRVQHMHHGPRLGELYICQTIVKLWMMLVRSDQRNSVRFFLVDMLQDLAHSVRLNINPSIVLGGYLICGA